MNCDERGIDEDQPWLLADMSRNMCEYGYILFYVITSLNYNYHQFDSLSWCINNDRSWIEFFKRQIDEDQPWLPANM